MSAKSELEKYLGDNKDSWHASAQLTRMTIANGDNTNANAKAISRRLQEMQNESILAVRYVGRKRTSEYRWIPPEWKERYVPSHTHGVDGSWQGRKQTRHEMLQENAAEVRKFDREYEADRRKSMT